MVEFNQKEERMKPTLLKLALQAHKLTGYDLGEYPCHPFLGSSQYYTVSKLGEFRNEYMCAEVSKNHDNGKGTVISSLHEKPFYIDFLFSE